MKPNLTNEQALHLYSLQLLSSLIVYESSLSRYAMSIQTALLVKLHVMPKLVMCRAIHQTIARYVRSEPLKVLL